MLHYANKNCSFTTGLSPAACLPAWRAAWPGHMISPMPSLYLNVPVWRRDRQNLLRFILFDFFLLLLLKIFFSFFVHLLFVCGKLAVQRCRRHLRLNFSCHTLGWYMHLFVDYIHLIASRPISNCSPFIIMPSTYYTYILYSRVSSWWTASRQFLMLYNSLNTQWLTCPYIPTIIYRVYYIHIRH